MPVTTTHKHYHLVGIEGVGMAALALILADKHLTVTGSDTGEGFETHNVLLKRSITIFDNFSSDHVHGADMVVYTGAHDGEKNTEVAAAQKMRITVQPLLRYWANCHAKNPPLPFVAVTEKPLPAHLLPVLPIARTKTPVGMLVPLRLTIFPEVHGILQAIACIWKQTSTLLIWLLAM